MAKFYQHMQPGDTLGKITKLKYIDDISDDELTLYVFEDQTKCDESYIAEVNNMDAFNGQFVMSELSSPLNKWDFKTYEFNLNETKTVYDKDGNPYEVPQPGIGMNGEHISVGINSEGKSTSRTIGNEGKRTDATPPTFVKNPKVEDKENYLLSLHPELLNGSKPVNKSADNVTFGTVVKKTEPTITANKKEIVNEITAPVEKQVITTGKIQTDSPITTSVIETVRHASITINLDNINSNSEYDKINVISNGKTTELSIEQFISRLNNEVTVKTEKKVSPYEDPNYTEDILITNMIDKSKKKVYTIGVDVELELPPKEVYKTIKDVYPDGMSEHFVTSISRRVDNNMLKEALAKGLTDYYETSLSDNKNQSTE